MDHTAWLDVVVFQRLLVRHLLSSKDEPNLVDLDSFAFLECVFHIEDLGSVLKVKRLLPPRQSLDLNLHRAKYFL